MNTPSQAQVRRAIAEAQTIVVKVGSSSLTEPSGHLDPQRLNALVAAIARVRLMGGRVVLVSSGAIAAGFGTLGFDKRPTDVADQQACAAVGQGLLMAQYEAAFARYGLRVGQILITVSDTIAPQQYRNVRRTLDRLLDLGAVPIINENDSLASNEIRFGDNDRLSALIAKRTRLEAHLLCAERRGRAGEGSGRRNRLERRHRRHGHQNGGRARRRGVRHSRGVDMRVERRSRDDGRSGRHRVRADQRPRFVT